MAGMDEPPETPHRDPDEPGCIYISSVLMAAAGVIILVFGGIMFWRADGAPPVHGIRDYVRAVYGIVSLVGVALIIVGGAIQVMLKIKRPRE